MRMVQRIVVLVALVLTCDFLTNSARADLIYNFNPANTWTGTAPAGSMTATFTDLTGANAGKVQLTITSNLGVGENLDPGPNQGALFFNLDPTKDPTKLSFAMTANTNFSQASTVMTGVNKFKADGDGSYDVLFTYSSGTKAFTNGESQTYIISSSSGALSSNDFDFWSQPPTGGNGPFLAAIHVQNTPNGGSGSAYVAGTIGSGSVVPEPSSIALGLIGLFGLGLTQIRRLIRRNPLALA